MTQVLTVPEASEQLRISEPKVREMVRRGVLKGFQDGRVIRIARESVEALASGLLGGASGPPKVVSPPDQAA